MKNTVYLTTLLNIYDSVDDIRLLLTDKKEDFPNIDFEYFEKEIEYWATFKEKFEALTKIITNIIKKNNVCTIEGKEPNQRIINEQPWLFSKELCFEIVEDYIDDGKLYKEDISEYLKPIPADILFELSEKRLLIINQVWRLLITDRAVLKWYIDNQRGDWIYTDEKFPPDMPTSLAVLLQEWKEKDDRINFHPMFNLIRLFFTYGVNYTPVLIILSEKQKSIYDCFSHTEKRLPEKANEINKSVMYQKRLNNGEKFSHLVFETSQGDFSFYEPMSQACMESMYRAIQQTEGAETWFRTTKKMESGDPMFDRLASITDKEMGHSGMSMHWTFTQFKCIYQEGWEHWVSLVFLGMGVGWEQINFDKAFLLKRDDVLLYNLKKYNEKYPNFERDFTGMGRYYFTPNESTRFTVSEIMSYAVDKDWGDFVKYVLDTYEFSLSYYIRQSVYTQKKMLWRTNRLFLSKWEKMRVIDLTKIDYCNFIRELWHHIPKKHCNSNVREPTDEEILEKDEPYQIGGKYMYWISKKKGIFDPFHLDMDLNEDFGFTRGLANLYLT